MRLKQKIQEKAKTIKISRDWSDSSMYFCSYGHLAQLVPELHAGSTMEVTLVRLEVAQQEIDKLKTFRDNAYKKWCESEDKIKVLLEERDLLKQKLHEMAVATSLETVERALALYKLKTETRV